MDDPLSEVPDEIRAFIDNEFSAVSIRSTEMKTAGRDGSIPDLFHCTNAETVRLILDSRSLWATHAQFLNDTSEFHYGTELVKCCLEAAKLSATENKGKKFIHDAQQLFFEKVLEDEGSLPYVVAFSADDGNRLSQWRA
jgi:hypothetical protein